MEQQLIEIILKILQNGNPKYSYKYLIKEVVPPYCKPTKQQTSDDAARKAIDRIIKKRNPKILKKKVDWKTDDVVYQVSESFETFKFLSTIFTSDETLKKIKDGGDFFYTDYAQKCLKKFQNQVYEHIKKKRNLDIYEPPESMALMKLLTISPSALFYAMSDEDLDIDYALFIRKVLVRLASDCTENRTNLSKDITGLCIPIGAEIELRELHNLAIHTIGIAKIPKSLGKLPEDNEELPIYEVEIDIDGKIKYNGRESKIKYDPIIRRRRENSNDVMKRFNERLIKEYKYDLNNLKLTPDDCPIKPTERPEEWYSPFRDWYQEQSNKNQ